MTDVHQVDMVVIYTDNKQNKLAVNITFNREEAFVLVDHSVEWYH